MILTSNISSATSIDVGLLRLRYARTKSFTIPYQNCDLLHMIAYIIKFC